MIQQQPPGETAADAAAAAADRGGTFSNDDDNGNSGNNTNTVGSSVVHDDRCSDGDSDDDDDDDNDETSSSSSSGSGSGNGGREEPDDGNDDDDNNNSDNPIKRTTRPTTTTTTAAVTAVTARSAAAVCGTTTTTTTTNEQSSSSSSRRRGRRRQRHHPARSDINDSNSNPDDTTLSSSSSSSSSSPGCSSNSSDSDPSVGVVHCAPPAAAAADDDDDVRTASEPPLVCLAGTVGYREGQGGQDEATTTTMIIGTRQPSTDSKFHRPAAAAANVGAAGGAAANGGDACTANNAAGSSSYTYDCMVDPSQEDRACEILLYSNKRPHMRAFHLAWSSFFVAFFTWFALTPLLGEIMISLQLSEQQIWTSSVLAVSSSAVTRAVLGPVNDAVGARTIMTATLIAAAIPTAAAGLWINSAHSLYLTRLVIGTAGSAFVTCQYWTTCTFTVEVAGTANALTAGWGNLGGGIAQVVMGAILFPIFREIFRAILRQDHQQHHHQQQQSHHHHATTAAGMGGDGSGDDDGFAGSPPYDRASDLAWRTILVFPALMCLGMAAAVMKFGDDTPKGNVRKRRAAGQLPAVSVVQSFVQGAANANTWFLFLQYACCFGVEITMTQAAALYFSKEFGQSTAAAAAIASIFGWMNLFARGIGGFASDVLNAKAGLRGRLFCQVILLSLEGILVIGFSRTHSLAGAICVMCLFSIFVQAAEGSTFAVVPYVDSAVTGSIAGFVGAGGNVGGIVFALLFWALLDDRKAFLWMGFAVLSSTLWSFCIYIPGHRTLLGGRDADQILERRQKTNNHLPAVITFETVLPAETTPAAAAATDAAATEAAAAPQKYYYNDDNEDPCCCAISTEQQQQQHHQENV